MTQRFLGGSHAQWMLNWMLSKVRSGKNSVTSRGRVRRDDGGFH